MTHDYKAALDDIKAMNASVHNVTLSDIVGFYAKHIDTTRAALELAAQGRIVPEGWVAVPIEPTEIMSYAGDTFTKKAFAKGFECCPDQIYKAMLAAAPSASAVERSEEKTGE